MSSMSFTEDFIFVSLQISLVLLYYYICDYHFWPLSDFPAKIQIPLES